MAILSTLSVGANAAEIGAQLGTQHTELNALIAPEPTGIFILQTGLTIIMMAVILAVSARVIRCLWVKPIFTQVPRPSIWRLEGDNGFAAPIGGGVRVHFSDEVYAYGEGYTAPRGLNNAVENYVEVDAGLARQVRDEVKLKAGYRHISVHGKSGTPNHTLLDGAYGRRTSILNKHSPQPYARGESLHIIIFFTLLLSRYSSSFFS